MRILAVDVGNSRVKAVRLVRTGGGFGQVDGEWSFRGADPVRVAGALKEVSCDAVVIGAVAELGAELCAALRDSRAQPVTLFTSGDEFPMEADVEVRARLGVDRLAAALAAWQGSAGRGALVADLGTAITVDWVDARGVFRGGAIVPGRHLAARCLKAGTDRLPEVPLDAPGPLRLPGRSTDEAIRRGLDVGWRGMVKALVEDLRAAAGGPLELWVTGGDADWLLQGGTLTGKRDPHLVARGLAGALQRLAQARESRP